MKHEKSKQDKSKKKQEIAIQVKNVSKAFRIPHQKMDSLRGAFVGAFNKKTYTEFNALKDISFDVKKGEFFGIIGRNGSGKSTLLKILAGIYNPEKGGVKIHGMISPFLELGIGFNPELSGRDNIYLNATVLGMTKKQIDEKFNDIVRFSELEQFIDERLKNYSSGMQVRLAFSVSIHANRDILLMDEVLAVGDSNFQSKCLEEFNTYRKQGRTVVLVTHDIGTVQRYCNRAMLLRKGKIEMIGDPQEVGNEYVYQNMSDEEKRIVDEEKLQKEKEKLEKKQEEKTSEQKEQKPLQEEKKQEKKKIAEITHVAFLDKEGKEKNVFQTGEAIDIFVKVQVRKKDIKDLNIGFGLHASFGGQIFGYNTQMDEIDIGTGNCSVKLHFDALPVLTGEYVLNVACWGKIEQNHYDFKPSCKTLKLVSTGKKNRYRGFFDIEHKWIT